MSSDRDPRYPAIPFAPPPNHGAYNTSTYSGVTQTPVSYIPAQSTTSDAQAQANYYANTYNQSQTQNSQYAGYYTNNNTPSVVPPATVDTTGYSTTVFTQPPPQPYAAPPPPPPPPAPAPTGQEAAAYNYQHAASTNAYNAYSTYQQPTSTEATQSGHNATSTDMYANQYANQTYQQTHNYHNTSQTAYPPPIVSNNNISQYSVSPAVYSGAEPHYVTGTHSSTSDCATISSQPTAVSKPPPGGSSGKSKHDSDVLLTLSLINQHFGDTIETESGNAANERKGGHSNANRSTTRTYENKQSQNKASHAVNRQPTLKSDDLIQTINTVAKRGNSSASANNYHVTTPQSVSSEQSRTRFESNTSSKKSEKRQSSAYNTGGETTRVKASTYNTSGEQDTGGNVPLLQDNDIKVIKQLTAELKTRKYFEPKDDSAMQEVDGTHDLEHSSRESDKKKFAKEAPKGSNTAVPQKSQYLDVTNSIGNLIAMRANRKPSDNPEHVNVQMDIATFDNSSKGDNNRLSENENKEYSYHNSHFGNTTQRNNRFSDYGRNTVRNDRDSYFERNMQPNTHIPEGERFSGRDTRYSGEGRNTARKINSKLGMDQSCWSMELHEAFELKNVSLNALNAAKEKLKESGGSASYETIVEGLTKQNKANQSKFDKLLSKHKSDLIELANLNACRPEGHDMNNQCWDGPQPGNGMGDHHFNRGPQRHDRGFDRGPQDFNRRQPNFDMGPQHFGDGPPFCDGPQNFDGGPRNFRGGPRNFRGGPRNLAGGPRNFRDGPPNFDCGPPNFDDGPPHFGGGPPNFGGGPPNFGGSPPNFDGGPPNFDGGPPNFGNGPPNFGGGPRKFRGGPRNFCGGPPPHAFCDDPRNFDGPPNFDNGPPFHARSGMRDGDRKRPPSGNDCQGLMGDFPGDVQMPDISDIKLPGKKPKTAKMPDISDIKIPGMAKIKMPGKDSNDFKITNIHIPGHDSGSSLLGNYPLSGMEVPKFNLCLPIAETAKEIKKNIRSKEVEQNKKQAKEKKTNPDDDLNIIVDMLFDSDLDIDSYQFLKYQRIVKYRRYICRYNIQGNKRKQLKNKEESKDVQIDLLTTSSQQHMYAGGHTDPCDSEGGPLPQDTKVTHTQEGFVSLRGSRDEFIEALKGQCRLTGLQYQRNAVRNLIGTCEDRIGMWQKMCVSLKKRKAEKAMDKTVTKRNKTEGASDTPALDSTAVNMQDATEQQSPDDENVLDVVEQNDISEEQNQTQDHQSVQEKVDDIPADQSNLNERKEEEKQCANETVDMKLNKVVEFGIEGEEEFLSKIEEDNADMKDNAQEEEEAMETNANTVEQVTPIEEEPALYDPTSDAEMSDDDDDYYNDMEDSESNRFNGFDHPNYVIPPLYDAFGKEFSPVAFQFEPDSILGVL